MWLCTSKSPGLQRTPRLRETTVFFGFILQFYWQHRSSNHQLIFSMYLNLWLLPVFIDTAYQPCLLRHSIVVHTANVSTIPLNVLLRFGWCIKTFGLLVITTCAPCWLPHSSVSAGIHTALYDPPLHSSVSNGAI